MRLRLAALVLLVLGACAPSAMPQRPGAPEVTRLPPMKLFAASRATPPTRPNADIARDFIELSFGLESGRSLAVFTRFEGPIRVGLRGEAPATAAADLDRLIARLQDEARTDIARARPGQAANLWIEFVPRRTLSRAVPEAACFVIPRNASFREFRAHRREAADDWAQLDTRRAATVFAPADVAPQEVRDCLHEEVAQALGPLNDLYRLPDSVFNDDNFHSVLTGFDMMILRATYAPELRSGMRREQVAARLPAILDRINPAGRRPAGPLPAPENDAWKDAIEAALGPRPGTGGRRAAAGRAVQIARGEGWRDVRLPFSLFTLGRTALPREIDMALAAYAEAGALYRALPEAQLQAAHVNMQLAAFALSAGRPEQAIELADAAAPAALRGENAALLATLLLVKAESLEALGRTDEAEAVRLDSLGWARYGFGSDAEVRRHAGEIAALGPATPIARKDGP